MQRSGIFVYVLLLSVITLSGAPLFLRPQPNQNNAVIQEDVAVRTLPASAQASVEKEAPVATKPTELTEPKPKERAFIAAEAAFSAKVNGGEQTILFSKDPNQKLPMASLTKLMTALVVVQKYQLDNAVPISKQAMAQVGEQGVLKQGEVLSVKDLLYSMLIESSNRAAYALAEVMGPDAFVAAMNEQAGELGLLKTHFEDPTGLSPKSYSTVSDLAKLTWHIVENYPLLKDAMGLEEYSVYLADGTLHHKLETTNMLLGKHGIIAGKTGYTSDAKGCVMEIQQKSQDEYVIHIILGAEDRFLEMEKLISLTGTR